VRECQVTIQSNQDLAITLQTQTNRLLGAAVQQLEETVVAAGEVGGAAAGRLQQLCDELAGSLTGLMAAQDEMGRRETADVATLDRLVKSAASMVAAQEVAAGQPRKRGADLLGREQPPHHRLALSPQQSKRARRGREGEEEQEEEVSPPQVRQPMVRVERQSLSASQCAQLRDEFAEATREEDRGERDMEEVEDKEELEDTD